MASEQHRESTARFRPHQRARHTRRTRSLTHMQPRDVTDKGKVEPVRRRYAARADGSRAPRNTARYIASTDRPSQIIRRTIRALRNL